MTITGKRPDFIKMAKEYDYLNKHEVAVGFFGDRDAKLLTIVRANEYGATIKPKKGKYLIVPHKVNGKLVGYYKLKEVVIPARPFIRMAWHDNADKYKRMVLDGLDAIFRGDTTGHLLLEKLGQESVKDIQKSAISLNRPENAPLTKENKRSSNPLVDTGDLERKVTYKIIRI